MGRPGRCGGSRQAFLLMGPENKDPYTRGSGYQLYGSGSSLC